MKLTEEIARDLRAGAIFFITGERIGVRNVRRLWFNPASGHYIADVGFGWHMWTDSATRRQAWNYRILAPASRVVCLFITHR